MAAILVSAAGPPLHAQTFDPHRPVRSYARAVIENDFFALRIPTTVPDYEYTNGLELEWVTTAGWRVGLGQKMYTPRRVASRPLPGERPYAAWLYGEIGHYRPGPRLIRDFSLAAGVVGPEALGEPVQNGFHRVAFSAPEPFWDQQLKEGPVFLATGTFSEPLARGYFMGIAPFQKVELGTRRIGVEAGTEILFGSAGPLGLPTRRRGFGASLVGSVAWRPWDLFLDRRPADHLPPLERPPLVATFQAGLSRTAGPWTLELRFVRHTREYVTQRARHGYGAIALTRTLSR